MLIVSPDAAFVTAPPIVRHGCGEAAEVLALLPLLATPHVFEAWARAGRIRAAAKAASMRRDMASEGMDQCAPCQCHVRCHVGLRGTSLRPSTLSCACRRRTRSSS